MELTVLNFNVLKISYILGSSEEQKGGINEDKAWENHKIDNYDHGEAISLIQVLRCIPQGCK